MSGVILAARRLLRWGGVDELGGTATTQPVPAEPRMDHADARRDRDEPPREAAATWLPAGWSADEHAEAQLVSFSESSEADRVSRWLPEEPAAGGEMEAHVPPARAAALPRRRAVRLAAPTRQQTLGGLALALAVAAAVVVLPAARNLGGDSAGVAVAKTPGHGGAGVASQADVSTAQPGGAAGTAATGGVRPRSGTAGTPVALAGTATPAKSGAGTAPPSSSRPGGSPRQTSSSTSSSSPAGTPVQAPPSSGSAPAQAPSSTSVPVSTSSATSSSATENAPSNSGAGSGGPVQSAVSTVQSTAASATSTAASTTSTAQAVASTATSAVPAPPSTPSLP